MEVMAGYKQTEVGVIPEDWEGKTFEDVMIGFTSGQTPSRTKPEYFKGDIPWITSGELNYNIIKDTIEKITVEAVQNTNLKIIPKGTFLFAITGLEAEGTRGSCAITGIDATTNQSCMALYPTDALTTKYLFYYYEKFGNWLAFRYCQGTKQQSYSGAIAKKLPIIYPPNKDEQRAIATALIDVDALLISLDQIIAKKRDIKQAAMQELLTGKRRLPGFSGEWETKGFDQVFKKQNAKNHQIQTREYFENGLYPVIDQGKNAIVAYSDQFEKLFHTPKGGVIVFGDHTRIVKFADFDFLVGADGAQILAINEIYSTKFFYYQLCVKEIPNTGYNRHYKFLKEMSFLVPSLLEQQAIATVLSDMDTDLAVLEQKRDKTKAIKQGMMQELLTGRIRLV